MTSSLLTHRNKAIFAATELLPERKCPFGSPGILTSSESFKEFNLSRGDRGPDQSSSADGPVRFNRSSLTHKYLVALGSGQGFILYHFIEGKSAYHVVEGKSAHSTQKRISVKGQGIVRDKKSLVSRKKGTSPQPNRTRALQGIAETFRGRLDDIRDGVAYITLYSQDGQTIDAQWPEIDLAKEKIGKSDLFELTMTDNSGVVRSRFRKISRERISDELWQQIQSLGEAYSDLLSEEEEADGDIKSD